MNKQNKLKNLISKCRLKSVPKGNLVTLFQFILVCVCVCARACVCECIHLGMHIVVRSEVYVRHPPLLSSSLLFETESYIKSRDQDQLAARLGIFLLLPLCFRIIDMDHLFTYMTAFTQGTAFYRDDSFYIGVADLSSGSYLYSTCLNDYAISLGPRSLPCPQVQELRPLRGSMQVTLTSFTQLD